MQVMITCGDITGAVVKTLKDPQTSENRHYLIQNSPLMIYELQANDGNKYSSFFVDSNIISNGTFHIATPIDPIFIVLPILCEVAVKWSPVDQLCMELPFQFEDGISQLEHLCETSDMLGDDTVLHKFSEERAISWLTEKHRLAFDVVQKMMVKQKQAYAGSTSSLNQPLILDAGDDYNNAGVDCHISIMTLNKAEEKKANEAAFQIVGEYLNSTWRKKLSTALDISTDTLSSNQQKKCGKRSATWDADHVDDDIADQLEQYTMGVVVSPESAEKEAAKKKLNAAKSVGLKKLSKVKTKGMKSLGSFFSAKKKKKS